MATGQDYESYSEDEHKSQLKSNIAECASLQRKFRWIRCAAAVALAASGTAAVLCALDLHKGRRLDQIGLLLNLALSLWHTRTMLYGHRCLKHYQYLHRQMQALLDNWNNNSAAIMAIDQILAQLQAMK